MRKTVECRNIQNEVKTVAVEDLSFRIGVYGVVIKDNKVLLSPQFGKYGEGYDFPGGGVDLGETLEEALLREVKEETGLSVEMDKLVHVATDFFIHPSSDKPLHTMLLYYSCVNPQGEISTTEFDEHEKEYMQAAVWMPVEEAMTKKFYNPVDNSAIMKLVLEGKGI